MSVFMPLDAKRYQQLTDDEIEHIHQFLFRFAKLQDAMGEKLFMLKLRKIRNNIAHQYEDETQQTAEALNAIYASKAILEKIYTSLKASYVGMLDKG